MVKAVPDEIGGPLRLRPGVRPDSADAGGCDA
jgi:hypothetical protein